jgi:hypothetical protein
VKCSVSAEGIIVKEEESKACKSGRKILALTADVCAEKS